MTIARKLNFSGFAPKFCGLGSDISFAESDSTHNDLADEESSSSEERRLRRRSRCSGTGPGP